MNRRKIPLNAATLKNNQIECVRKNAFSWNFMDARKKIFYEFFTILNKTEDLQVQETQWWAFESMRTVKRGFRSN